MKYRLLAPFVGCALLLAGCQDRSGLHHPSSSEAENSSSASEGPGTPLETALDEYRFSPSHWQRLETPLSALGISSPGWPVEL